MAFKLDRGIQCELLTRTDVLNILRALEPQSTRSRFEQGYAEALRRVGLAFAITYEASEQPRMLESGVLS